MRKEKNVSKWDKLLSKILSLSNDLRFDELRKVLESCGYEMRNPGGGSSHVTFRKTGCAPITIPRSSPVKRACVEKVKNVVTEKEKENENA